MRKIAISDIHGCLQTFQQLLEGEIALQPEDQLFLLGDYIDRGPDSKGVIDYIQQLQEEGYQLHCLRGNHEAMLMEAFTNRSMRNSWMRNGGVATLQSFGVQSLEEIPEPYLDFFSKLAYFKEVDDFLLVHAGLNFNRKNPLIDRESMLWARSWEQDINYPWLGNRVILYGHTPQKKQKITKDYSHFPTNQYLGIDAGCVFYDEPGYGHLCAFDFSTWELFFCKNQDY